MNSPSTTSNINSRQQAILDFARNHGKVEVDPLANSFAVTPQTIRRDLNELCNLRLLQRVHGGAVIHDGVVNLGYNARKCMNAQEKAAIGQRVAKLIPDDSSLFINVGTTTEQVAEHLSQHIGLLVITNNINVVNTLRSNTTAKVMTAGGLVRCEDGGIVGDSTVSFMQQFKVDYAVIGASAIEPDGTILDFDIREVQVAKAIINNARTVILVADGMKFQRNAPVRIGDISLVNKFVTDTAPPPEFMARCRQANVTIEVTGLEQT